MEISNYTLEHIKRRAFIEGIIVGIEMKDGGEKKNEYLKGLKAQIENEDVEFINKYFLNKEDGNR